MASLTIENYAKAIYQITSSQGDKPASTGRVAEALGVLPGTVTSMLKTLSEAGLVIYTPYEGVNLSDAGKTLALRVIRRHRLIELFLVRSLNLKWDEVHAEAEHLEHAVSDWLVDKIDAYLGLPDADPHGDPIPRSDGSLPSGSGCGLTELPIDARFKLTRVLDQSPDFLRYLSEAGLALGLEGQVASNRAESGVLTFRHGKSEATLSRQVAEKLVVERVES